jgi:hypothetical protein
VRFDYPLTEVIAEEFLHANSRLWMPRLQTHIGDQQLNVFFSNTKIMSGGKAQLH